MDNEFLIELQAKLNEAKSKENINVDISKIQDQLDKLKIQAEIDPNVISNLTKQLEEILNQKIVISDVNVDNRQISKVGHTIGKIISDNAEYAATSLKTKDISIIKIDESNKLDIFIEKMEQSGHYTDDLKNKVTQLKSDLSNVFDSDSLTKYLNEISNLQSEFQKVDAIAKTAEKSIKLQKNIDAEKKVLQVYTTELKEAGVLTGDLKTKIQEMFHSLSKVNTQNGLSTWKAELKGVKAETDAVLKSVTRFSKNKNDDILSSIDNKTYEKQLSSLIASYNKLGLTNEEIKFKTNDVSLALDRLKEKNLDTLESDAENFTNVLKKSQNEAAILKTQLDSIYNPKKQSKLSNDIQNWLSKNSRASKEAKQSLNEYYRELNSGRVSIDRLNFIESELKNINTIQRGLGKLGKNFIDQFKDIGKNFTQLLSVSSGVMLMVSKAKEAISELKNLDNILTEISKTSNLTNQQLKNLGNSAFESASKYGKSASDYLIGVQEMYRAGFHNAEQMSELSILAQAAGDMDATTANNYLIASNAAYNLKGNIEELNKVLDGQNYITNNAAVNMLDMAQATSEAASIASQYGIKIDELSALIATATSKTRESGSETGNALKSLFVNLQDTTSKPISDAFAAVNISMTEMVNGSEKLKTPIALLKELSDAFVNLNEDDTKRANILSDIGGKYHANTLSAILSDWASYEKMLNLYSQGIGSAAEEAEKSANNWEGSLIRLSNTWTNIVSNITNSDVIIDSINILNSLFQTINGITDSLGSMGTLSFGAAITGLSAFVKSFA